MPVCEALPDGGLFHHWFRGFTVMLPSAGVLPMKALMPWTVEVCLPC